MPNFGGPDQLIGLAARGSARGVNGGVAGLNRSEEQEMQHEEDGYEQDNEMRRMRTNYPSANARVREHSPQSHEENN